MSLWREFWDLLNSSGDLSQLAAESYGPEHPCDALTDESEEAQRARWQMYRPNLVKAKTIVSELRNKSKIVDSTTTEAKKLRAELSAAQQSGASSVAMASSLGPAAGIGAGLSLFPLLANFLPYNRPKTKLKN